MAEKSVTFDRAAAFYDETRGFPPGKDQQAAALFQQAGNLTAHSRILEIGIGTGRIALPVAARTDAHITGVDISAPMLERLLAKREPTESVEVLLADATSLPLPSNAFDALIVTHVFHLIPDWKTALAEAARVLKPDGVLLHGWNDYGTDTLWQVWYRAVPRPERLRKGIKFSERKTFLPDNGWREAREPLVFHFASDRTPEMFLKHIEGRVWSSTWEVSDEHLAAGVAAIRAVVERDGTLNQPFVTSFEVTAHYPPA